MGEEIEFEAVAQHRVVDLADAALPGRAGIGDDDVDAAECSATRSKAARTEAGSVTSQARPSAVPPSFLAAASAALPSMSRSATSAPASTIARAVATPMVPAPPVTTAIWPASGFSAAWPSLACSSDQYSMSNRSASLTDSNRPTASASVTVSIVDLGDVGGDRGVPGAAAEPEEPEPRHQDDPRHRVELALRRRLARVMAGEIGVVVGDETIDRLAHRGLELVEPAGLGRRHDQRVVLGADRVVGGGDAGLAIALELGAVDVVEHRRRRRGNRG